MANSPIMSLMQDPAFAAFVTASGMQDELANADAARRRQSINQALGIQEEGISDEGQQARRNIAGDQESRGMYRSGQTLRRTADSEKSQARASALAQLNAADQMGDVESGLLTGQANRQMAISQNALDALNRQLTQQGDDSIRDQLAQLGGQAQTPLTGISSVSPLDPAANQPGAVPIPGVGISRQQAFNPTGKYKRAF